MQRVSVDRSDILSDVHEGVFEYDKISHTGMNKEFTSNPLALILSGKWRDILCPWILALNCQDNILRVSKRNWFLIGEDEQIVPFRLIRRININTHFFGADVEISVFGSGKISAFCLSKVDAQEIKNLLIQNNIKKKS